MGFLNLFKKPQFIVAFVGGSGESVEKAIIIQGVPNLQALLEAEVNFFRRISANEVKIGLWKTASRQELTVASTTWYA